MLPQTKMLELSEAGRSKDLPCHAPEGIWPCQHLDFGLLASRVIKEFIFVVLSQTVYGIWL